MDWTKADVLTALMAAITAVYAGLTHGILAATRRSVVALEKQTEALSRPYVTISPFVLPGSVMVYLRVSNTGKSAAEQLRLTLDRPFYQFGESHERKNLQTYAAFSQEIASFAPGAEFVFALHSAVPLFAENVDEGKTPLTFKVTARFAFGPKRVEEVTHVDVRPYKGMHMAFDPLITALGKITDALEKQT